MWVFKMSCNWQKCIKSIQCWRKSISTFDNFMLWLMITSRIRLQNQLKKYWRIKKTKQTEHLQMRWKWITLRPGVSFFCFVCWGIYLHLAVTRENRWLEVPKQKHQTINNEITSVYRVLQSGKNSKLAFLMRGIFCLKD